jgi:hypothetical protein
MDKDITTLLKEIKAKTGWSELRIRDELGISISQPTVNRILNGQEDCKGSTDRAIRALHQRVFLRAAAQPSESPALPHTNPDGAKAREAKAKAMVGRMKIDPKNLAQ